MIRALTYASDDATPGIAGQLPLPARLPRCHQSSLSRRIAVLLATPLHIRQRRQNYADRPLACQDCEIRRRAGVIEHDIHAFTADR